VIKGDKLNKRHAFADVTYSKAQNSSVYAQKIWKIMIRRNNEQSALLKVIFFRDIKQ
jgi:hypothetical protein